jgi:hypothetical protein
MVSRIYPNVFDLVICHNNLSLEQLETLSTFGVRLHEQDPFDFPLDIQPDIHPAWKIYPPRIRKDSHEIIIDNDIILLNKIPQIEEFLSSSDKHILTHPICRSLGFYDEFVPKGFDANSGIIGFPPGYDFAGDITKYSCNIDEWDNHFDEQGLVTYCLYRYDPLMIDLDIVVGDNRVSRIDGEINDYGDNLLQLEHKLGIHFAEVNKGKSKSFDNYMMSKLL